MNDFKKYTTYDYNTGSTTVTYTGSTTATSHAPNSTIIDLDYPLYGTVIVKSGGQKYDLEVVKAALRLVSAMKGVVLP